MVPDGKPLPFTRRNEVTTDIAHNAMLLPDKRYLLQIQGVVECQTDGTFAIRVDTWQTTPMLFDSLAISYAHQYPLGTEGILTL
jgi:hypothetical protein